MRAIFNITTSNRVIVRRIREALKLEMRDYLSRHIRQVRTKARVIIHNYIMNSAEMQDLLRGTGKLRTELGVVDPTTAMDGIIDIWTKSVHLMIKYPRKHKDGVQLGFRLLGVRANWEDVLSSGIGQYTTLKGETIPWLDWLLRGGSKVLVRDYDIAFGYPSISRTGDAIMLQGSGWVVPPSAQGTSSNNFVTRAIDACLPAMETMIIDELTK